MVCYYPYKQSFSGERLLARMPSCFYIVNRVPERHIRVPERHIDLACVICYKIMSTLSFKIMKKNTQKLCRIFHELVVWCLEIY